MALPKRILIFKIILPTIFGISCIAIPLTLFWSKSFKPESLAKFFSDNNYNLIYPLDDKPVPGEIYEETKDKGLARALAYKETCAKDLNFVESKTGFGTRSAESEIGINFLLATSLELVPKVHLEAAFKKEVSYTVTSDLLDTFSCDWVTLRSYFREKIPLNAWVDCYDALLKDNAVVLSKVAATQKFVFKFRGLKSGGIDVIRQELRKAGLKVEKTDEETIVLEYDRPMKLCYQRWTPEELGIYARGAGPAAPPPLTEADKEIENKITEIPQLNDFTKEFFGIKE